MSMPGEPVESPLVLVLRRFVSEGSAEKFADFLASSLASAGYAVAVASYRIPPEASFPTAVKDAEDALHFCRKLDGVDGSKSFVVGLGGGGYVAAMMGLQPERRPRLHGVVGIGAAFDITRPPEQHYPVFRKTILAFMGKPYEGNEEAYEQASPVFCISDDSPPFLLIHGEDDDTIPISQSEAFAAALHEHGVPVLFRGIPGEGRVFRQNAWVNILGWIESFFDHLLPYED